MATSGWMSNDHRSKTLQQMVKERDVRIDQLLDELDRKTRVSAQVQKRMLVKKVHVGSAGKFSAHSWAQ